MRRQRVIAIDLETGTILNVCFLDYDEKDPTRQCILEHRSFYPRWAEKLFPGENKSASRGRVYQHLDKLDLYITNSPKHFD